MSANVRFDSLCDKVYRPTHGDFVTRLALRMSISDLAEVLPLNICLLIDRSNSMRGAKIDAARSSARSLVEVLRPGDRFSLIAFSGSADVLLKRVDMDDFGKEQAQQAISSIQPSGVTRMDLALSQGYELLDGGPDFMNMLWLLSDGAPTNQAGYVLKGDDLDGLRASIGEALAEHAIVTSTVGLGDAADCLAPFLESCAEYGQGVFYHEKDPDNLAERFLEEFDRVKATAVSDARFVLENLDGRVRKAAAIYPDLRELQARSDDNGALVLDVGGLQKGEEHAFLLEIVTSGAGEPARRKLCDVSVSYRADGAVHQEKGQATIIELTEDEALLNKPGHEDVEKFKSMYTAYQQTRFAADNVRSGGDAKKTRALIESAAKTTRRLGMTKQTKLLNAMAESLDGGGSLNENQLTEMSTATRKTKVLNA